MGAMQVRSHPAVELVAAPGGGVMGIYIRSVLNAHRALTTNGKLRLDDTAYWTSFQILNNIREYLIEHFTS